MGLRSADTARQLARIGPTDRTRTVALIDRAGAAGALSYAEREDRLELVFRARIVGELDAAVSGLPGAAELQLHVRGLGRSDRGLASWSWHRRLLLWSLGSVVFWTIVWFVSGGSFLWLLASWLLSLLAFTFRFARRGRRGGSSRTARRRSRAFGH